MIKIDNNNISIINILYKKMDIPFKLLRYLLVLVIFLVILGGLSLRKLKLFCFGCQRGSWWYECLPGTGYGSVSCDVYKETYNTIVSLVNSLTLVKEQIETVIRTFTNIYNKIRGVINSAGNAIKNGLKLPDVSISNLDVPNISCNTNIIGDICSPLNSAVRGIISSLNSAGSFLQILFNQIKNVFNEIIKFLGLVVDEFMKIFNKLFNDMLKPIEDIYRVVAELRSEINSIYMTFIDMGITDILIYHVMSGLYSILPIKSLITTGVALLLIGLVWGLITIGVIFSSITILKDILSGLGNIFTEIKSLITGTINLIKK